MSSILAVVNGPNPLFFSWAQRIIFLKNKYPFAWVEVPLLTFYKTMSAWSCVAPHVEGTNQQQRNTISSNKNTGLLWDVHNKVSVERLTPPVWTHEISYQRQSKHSWWTGWGKLQHKKRKKPKKLFSFHLDLFSPTGGVDHETNSRAVISAIAVSGVIVKGFFYEEEAALV